jgi:hypothetical protein
MAVGSTEHPHPPRRRWFDALFGDAFELEHRRRRRRYLLTMLLTCAAAAALLLGLRDGGSAGSGARAGAGGHASASVRVSDATLPLPRGYFQLAAIGNRLLLTGGKQGGTPSVTDRCTAARVDPLTLAVSSTTRGSCADPALYGRTVLPVSYVAARRSPLWELGLRIALIAPHTRGGYRLGPTVIRYPQCSSCGLESIYGDGSLWIYAPFVAPNMQIGPSSGQLFRVSEQTGRVLERWSMPSFSRSLMATDDDGLWIAQSTFGGMPAPDQMKGDEAGEYRSMYRFTPGVRVPRRLLIGSGGYWMVAAGHSVWIDTSADGHASRLWHFTGNEAHPALNARPVAAGSDCFEMGEGQPSTAGDAQAGISCVDLTQNGGHIEHFDAATGAAQTIATAALKTDAEAAFDHGPGPAVVLGHSVYLLVGENRLFRVRS